MPKQVLKQAVTTPAENEPQVVLGWHWLVDPSKLRDGQPVRVGRIYRLPAGQHPELCYQGYHASEKLLDAIRYAPGYWLCRVELSGEIVRESYQQDKLVASQRRILWMMDAQPIIRTFLADLAEEFFAKMRVDGEEPHEDLVNAVAVTRAYLQGNATKREYRIAKYLFKETYNELRYSEQLSANSRLALEAVQGAISENQFTHLIRLAELGERYSSLTPSELNTRLEAAILAVAPKSAPPLKPKQRWDRTQKLRKPVCKGNKAVAATLTIRPPDLEATERLILGWNRIVNQRQQVYRSARDAERHAQHRVEAYVNEQMGAATPADTRTFNRELKKLMDATRCAAEQSQQAYRAWQRATDINNTRILSIFHALPKKQREALASSARRG